MLIQTSKIFKVSGDDAGDYAGSLNRDETVSGWEDLRGDPTIRLGDRVLLCRHRWIRGHGFDWSNSYNDRENLVNRVARVIHQQDPTELGIGHIEVRAEESYEGMSKVGGLNWWRTRDVIRLWPDAFSSCRECAETIQVLPKTPYDTVPRLCERCSSQKRQKLPRGPIQEIEDAKFVSCLDRAASDVRAARDKCVSEQSIVIVATQTPKDRLMAQREFCETFDRTGRVSPRTRAELKAKIEELQGRLDELGPEGNLVDVSDLSDWISKPMGVPKVPRKYKVEL